MRLYLAEWQTCFSMAEHSPNDMLGICTASDTGVPRQRHLRALFIVSKANYNRGKADHAIPFLCGDVHSCRSWRLCRGFISLAAGDGLPRAIAVAFSLAQGHNSVGGEAV